MASVQAPPAVQPPGAPMPAGATKQQAEEVFRVCIEHVFSTLDHYVDAGHAIFDDGDTNWCIYRS